MGAQVSPIFDAVEAEARRDRTGEKVITGAAICYRAKEQAGEIHMMRVARDVMRHNLQQRNDINGNLLTLDMHPMEYEACEYLCPLLKTADWQAQARAWRWILKQEWGQEFGAPQYEKTRF